MLTVKQLGRKGRFANQLLQYAHLRQRAIQENTDYCCPAWIGQKLFKLADTPITPDAVDIGFKFPLDADWYDPDLFCSLFQAALPLNTVAELQHAGRTVIGLHLRRGDYGTFTRRSARWAFVAPTDWYQQWLDGNLPRFANPILYVASDEPEKVLGDFSAYDTVYPAPEWPDAPFWRDFYALTQCDVLLISNSTFGYVASMLNDRAMEFYRPRLGEQKLIPYDPWCGKVVFLDERY